MRDPKRFLLLLVRTLRQLAQTRTQLTQDRTVMIGYHALLYRPAMYHQVATLSLINAVYACKFIYFHRDILL